MALSNRDQVRALVPKLVSISETVLYGDIWTRPELSPRDRSLVTIAALVGTSRPDQLKLHIQRGIENGLTRQEVGELITHLAFYCGWPSAMAAAHLANNLFNTADAGQ